MMEREDRSPKGQAKGLEMDKKRLAILGSTGAVGKEFVDALCEHPTFAISLLHASERSSMKQYAQSAHFDTAHLPDAIRSMPVNHMLDYGQFDVACSALPKEVAVTLEPEIASRKPVISTVSAFRYESDVPVLITEVNAEHAKLLRDQQRNRSWKGFIAPQPNCTTVGLAVSLKPIYDAFGIRKVFMTSYQAVSGAGYEAVNGWERERRSEAPLPAPFQGFCENPSPVFEGNVIGYISGEEEKVRAETKKILGKYRQGVIEPAEFDIDCLCIRVPVLEGHLEAVFVETQKHCEPNDVIAAMQEFNQRCRERYGKLHSSPENTITMLDRAPQPRFDANLDNGMTTCVGRVEKGEGNWIKYLVLSNNVKKGAALGSTQVLEYLAREGYI